MQIYNFIYIYRLLFQYFLIFFNLLELGKPIDGFPRPGASIWYLDCNIS